MASVDESVPMAGKVSVRQFYASVIDDIGNFVCFGTRPSPFVESIILQDRESAVNNYPDVVPDAEDHVRVLLEWSCHRLPRALFSRKEDIEEWIFHRGLKEAPAEKRILGRICLEWAANLVDMEEEK